jgi:hypothetical protein
MPRDLGSRRHNPSRVIDVWVYKVKDVEIERLDYVEPGEDDLDDKGRDERKHVDRHKRRKERVKNKVVKLELRMEKITAQSEEPPHPTREVKFELVCEELDIRMEGTDIEALRQAMWGVLDKKFEVKWEHFFLIEVTHQPPWGGGDGSGLIFSYKGVYRGTTWDGKYLLKEWDGNTMKIKPWPGKFTDRGGKVLACIEDTELNREALDQFSKRIDAMRNRLADFLRPETIMQTLTNLAGFALLPPPAEDDQSSEQNE